jgi:hypothetical protein
MKYFGGKLSGRGNWRFAVSPDTPESQAGLCLEPSQGENDEGERFVVVLEIPPVDSAKKAVQVENVKNVKHPRR